MFKKYEIGTQVTFKNFYVTGIRKGVISHWTPKYPDMYEITCDNDTVWYIREDMITEVVG